MLLSIPAMENKGYTKSWGMKSANSELSLNQFLLFNVLSILSDYYELHSIKLQVAATERS